MLVKVEKSFVNVSASTLRRELYVPVSAIRAFAADLRRCRNIKIEPPALPPATPPDWLWPQESVRLLHACKAHLRPLLLFLLHTGASPEEALYLLWEQIDLDRQEVSLSASVKSERRRRTIALHSPLVNCLRRLPLRSGRVFRCPDGSENGRPYKMTKRPASGFKTTLASAANDAGIRATYRTLQHTYCVWRLAVDRDADLAWELGERDPRGFHKFERINSSELDALRLSLREFGWEADFARPLLVIG